MTLGALNQVRAAMPDRDTAETIVRVVIENGLQNAVTAFQRVVEALFEALPAPPKARRNTFQNLTEGSAFWQQVMGQVQSVKPPSCRLSRENERF